MSNGLDPDQDRRSVGPDLGPNCLHSSDLQTQKIYMRRFIFYKIVYYVLTNALTDLGSSGPAVQNANSAFSLGCCSEVGKVLIATGSTSARSSDHLFHYNKISISKHLDSVLFYFLLSK